jgi:hypothetical protein
MIFDNDVHSTVFKEGFFVHLKTTLKNPPV